ncbi:MAG TPA: hypothetical protein VGE30_00760 [Candidatus Saccharimonadales bacterium]
MHERQPTKNNTAHKKNGALIILNRLESGYAVAAARARNTFKAAEQRLRDLDPGTRDAIWASIAGAIVITGMYLADDELNLTPRSESIVNYDNHGPVEQYTGDLILSSLGFSSTGMTEAEQGKSN